MSPALPSLSALALALGLGTGSLNAQSRPPLERPTAWEPAATSSGSITSGRGTAKIPDPAIFDGSGFPAEERPETAMIGQFEMPGAEPDPSKKNVKGPGQKPGGGGSGPGGDGQKSGSMSIPGLPPMGGGGAGEQQSGPPPLIAESQMGDPNASGEPGEQGEPGEGGEGDGAEGAGGDPGEAGNGASEAPAVASDQPGRELERPDEMAIGDEGATLAESDVPPSESSSTAQAEHGEARMGVKAASGSQKANKGKGTERGVPIPSNL